MDPDRLTQLDATTWQIPQQGNMRVPGILYADRQLVSDMDDKVWEQLVNAAALPGIVNAAYAMPDAHWGYGRREDLERIEEHGRMAGAVPEAVSERARRRQRDEMGTLGSGNHYLEMIPVIASTQRA